MTKPDPARTTREVAEQLGVKAQTLEKWRSTRAIALPFVKVGRSVRYAQSAVDAFVAAHTVK